jgi:hypothetical protein
MEQGSHVYKSPNKPPASPCAACQRAYVRERRKFTIVGNAASALSKLLGVDVTLEARYRREHMSDVGLKVIIVRLSRQRSNPASVGRRGS